MTQQEASAQPFFCDASSWNVDLGTECTSEYSFSSKQQIAGIFNEIKFPVKSLVVDKRALCNF